MRCRPFLSAFVALSGFVRPIGAAPNVIVIFVDDLGWPDAGPQWSADIATLGLGLQGVTDLLTRVGGRMPPDTALRAPARARGGEERLVRSDGEWTESLLRLPSLSFSWHGGGVCA